MNKCIIFSQQDNKVHELRDNTNALFFSKQNNKVHELRDNTNVLFFLKRITKFMNFWIIQKLLDDFMLNAKQCLFFFLNRITKFMNFGIIQKLLDDSMLNASQCLYPVRNERENLQLRGLVLTDFIGVFSIYMTGQ